MPIADRLFWSNYGPVIVSTCSERASGSHRCRAFSTSYSLMLGCHGTFGNVWERTGTEGKK